MARLSVFSTLVAALIAVSIPDVVLEGTAKDCFRRTYINVAGVTIGAFNPAKNRKMVDSVLVFGYAETEDELFYYSYRMVPARASSSFYLDMSGGTCHYPDSH